VSFVSTDPLSALISRSCTSLSCGLNLYRGRRLFRASSKEEEESSERARDRRVVLGIAAEKEVEEFRATRIIERRRIVDGIDMAMGKIMIL